MQITCSFRFELQPDKDQRSLMSRTAGCCRLVFNKALALQNELKEQHQKLLTYNELSQKLTAWKKESETIFLREVPSQPLQQTLMDLCKGISDSFHKSGDPAKKGWPHFKSKDIGDGFRLPQIKPEHIDEGNARVKLPKLGWVRYRKSRDMRFQSGNGSWVKGCVKQATVSKEVGKWFISFAVVFEIEQPAMKTLDVGIDLGVVHAVTTSDGRFFDLNTEVIKAQELKIAKLQRQLSLNASSRKKLAKKKLVEAFDKHHPSRKRRILLHRLQKAHQKIRRIRQDFHKKTAYILAQEYGCVYAEDLRVRNMTKSAKGTVENPGKNVKQKSGLNRSILRTGFYDFRRSLEWALQKEGGLLITVAPQYTSQTCPHCGHCDSKNRPKQAVFHCVRCGYEDNADVVGAINVKKKGRAGPTAHDKKRIACEVNGEHAGNDEQLISNRNHPCET